MGWVRHAVGSAAGWRWAATLLLALGCALVTGIGAPRDARAAAGADVTASSLNLRAEPGTWAATIGELGAGQYVAILDGPTADGWYQVAAGDQTGWVDGGFLSLDGAGGVADLPPPPERWVDVNRSSEMVTLFQGDQPVATYWAAMGVDPSADGYFATAVGTYYVYEMTPGLSWTPFAGAWVDDWVGFDPNRLNGFHSFSMDGDGNVLPDGAGPTGGCVALSPGAAADLFDFVSVGTRVEVHW